jgi:hypothetical protein
MLHKIEELAKDTSWETEREFCKKYLKLLAARNVM